MNDDNNFKDLAAKLEGLSAEDQRAVMSHLDTITSRDYMAAEAARKAEELQLRRQIEPLEKQLNEAMKHPSANAQLLRQLNKQLTPLWNRLEALK